MAKRKLGRGLGALIPARQETPPDAEAAVPAPETAADRVPSVPLTRIDPSPWQPRQRMDEEKLDALADSIREQGLVQPVVLRRRGERFELIAGERRFRAVQRLGWEAVPAVLMDAGDERMRELALVENLQRDDLNAIETAQAYKALQEELGLTHERIAERLGVSRASVTNMLRLLDLPEEVRAFVIAGQLSQGHVRPLLSLPDAMSQIRLAKRIVAKNLSVRAVEQLVKKGQAGTTAPRPAPSAPRSKAPFARDLEERLGTHLGTSVRVEDKNGQGRIVIEYYSPDDAGRVLRAMGLPENDV